MSVSPCGWALGAQGTHYEPAPRCRGGQALGAGSNAADSVLRGLRPSCGVKDRGVWTKGEGERQAEWDREEEQHGKRRVCRELRLLEYMMPGSEGS